MRLMTDLQANPVKRERMNFFFFLLPLAEMRRAVLQTT